MPEENYWYRRHLVVYEWIAARVAGLRVVDMACGEGYGSDVLAGAAAAVVGVDANPEAHEHARLRYTRPNLRFERDLVESFAEPCDAVVFLQTIEHVQDAGAILEHFKSMLAPGGDRLRLDPEPADAGAARGAEKSDNPWHLHEYRAEEFRRLCEDALRRGRALRPLPRPQAARPRARDQARLGRRPPAPRPDQALLRPLHAGDLRLRLRSQERRTSTRRWTSSPSAMSEPGVGDLAIVLHSHMPYVEGFGTYPFGEEWLFDAVIRSYLPVLEVAERLTMTVTPVLADQLEDEGVRRAPARVPGRVADRGRRSRPARGAGGVPAGLRGRAGPLPAGAGAARRRGRRSARRLPASGGGRAGGAGGLGRHPRGAAAAGDAAGAAAAARRRDPLAPPPLRLGRRLLAAGVRLRAGPRVAPGRGGGRAGSASTRAPARSRCRRWRRSRTAAGPVALPIDWEAIGWLWSLDGYPSDPAHAQFAGKSLRGVRLWKVGGGAVRPGGGRGGGAAPGGRVPRRRRGAAARVRGQARPPRPAGLRDRHRAARPLVVGGADLAAGGARGAPSRRGCGR